MIAFLALFTLGTLAGALEYDVHLGYGVTSARTDDGRVSPRPNARFGLGIEHALDPRWTLATGTDYVFRRVIWHRGDGARLAVDFDDVDVPLTVRYRVTPTFGLFGGLRVAISVSDKIETARGTPDVDADARAFTWFGELGARVEFPNRFALDAFFERDVGVRFANALDDSATLGVRVSRGF